MSVLVVDDSPEMLSQLQAILTQAGYKNIFLAGSSHEAYRLLGVDNYGSGVISVELIILNINMPEINGIDMCLAIKATRELEDTPIMMLTESDEVEELQTAFAAGAADYILKPVRKIELIARVRSVLKLKHEMDRRKAREEELVEVTKRLEKTNQMLRKVSSQDGLTGIANRRFFDEHLTQEWRRALRDAVPISLIMIDIDFFKAYNDFYGHQQGDDCLRQVSRAFGQSLRRPADIVARYGGEEFAVVLPDTDREGALLVAEAMRLDIENLKLPHEASGVVPFVTISLGVSTRVPDRNIPYEKLVAEADKALYTAKQAGRNRVVFYGDVR